MESANSSNLEPKSHIDEISTRWAVVGDPTQFVMRYARAIQSYLNALIRDWPAAQDVCQDFLLNVLSRGFAQADPDRGRFRNYLKAVVRNAAFMYFRRQKFERREPLDAEQRAIVDPSSLGGSEGDADRQWVEDWQKCVLDRAWDALLRRQRRSGDDLFYSVLRISADHPDAESDELAQRLSERLGRPISPGSYRMQRTRARRLFAELLVREVTDTLEDRHVESVEQELIDTGLMPFIRDSLPDDWRTWDCFKTNQGDAD
jgi:RNA polymerase sigma-70 factor (ECF subfamily)